MNTFAGTIEKPILVKKGEPIPQNTGGPGWTPKLNQNKIPKIDWDAWIYALRAACAGCLGLYISFSLNLAGWQRAPKRSNISEKCCSHRRNISRCTAPK
jgi:hypothetical protein